MSDRAIPRTVAILAADGVERVELTRPREALLAAGAECRLVSTDDGKIETYDHLDSAGTERVDETTAHADVRRFDALLLPGGVANPDFLRRDRDAVAFVRQFFSSGKPVAAICHAPWMLIEADVARGRSLTSWPSIRTDLVNAGARWSDEPVVRDGNLVTSRGPHDLDVFCSAMLELFGLAGAEGGLDDDLEESFPASDPPATTGGPAVH